MKKSLPKLIPEKEYLFTHKRKQTFRAVFKRIVRAPSTDTLDEFYYECEADSNLSANAWARMEDKTLLRLRPSMITLIQYAPPQHARPRCSDSPNRGMLEPSRENRFGGWFKTIRTAIRGLKRF